MKIARVKKKEWPRKWMTGSQMRCEMGEEMPSAYVFHDQERQRLILRPGFFDLSLLLD